MSKQTENNDSERQYEALADGKIDSKEMGKINSLKHDVQEKLLSGSDIFTAKDRERWLKQLEKAKDDSPDEIEAIARDIDREKAEIQEMTGSFIAKVNQDKQLFGQVKNKNKAESDQWIDAFKKKPVETKREWLKCLEEKIGELKELYDKAKALAPDKMEDFATMDRNEKTAFLGELESLRREADRFGQILEQNKDLFNAEESASALNNFNDLTAREQIDFISGFEKKDIPARKEVADKYKSFPQEYKQGYANFNSLNLIDKKITVDKMEKELVTDYQNKLFNAALSRHLSLGSKVGALKWFMEAPNKQRGQALKLLDSQMKVEEELSGQYEELIESMDAGADQIKINDLKEKFYNSTFDDKKFFVIGRHFIALVFFT